jgi:phospholipid-binding lipoprotein MlaA
MHSKFSGKLASCLGLAALLCLLAGCATRPPADDPDAIAEFEQTNDPFEPANRAVFDANNWFADNVLTPAVIAYRWALPKDLRDRVTDLLANLKSPEIFGNDVLQGNFTRAGVTLSRFVLNSSFGVGGLMDVASRLGLPGHTADVGETFAVWGIGDGPYLVLPLIGPSNPRDAIGYGIDSYFDPLDYYINENDLYAAATAKFLVTGISAWDNYMDVVADVKRTSLDYYSASRSLFRQHRDAQIKDAVRGVWAPNAAQKPQ